MGRILPMMRSGGGANSLNPADQRATFNTRPNGTTSWKYLTSMPGVWEDGDITVDCVKSEILKFIDIQNLFVK